MNMNLPQPIFTPILSITSTFLSSIRALRSI
jgi:hypothetical protein